MRRGPVSDTLMFDVEFGFASFFYPSTTIHLGTHKRRSSEIHQWGPLIKIRTTHLSFMFISFINGRSYK